MHIIIFGAGAMGSLFGSYLSNISAVPGDEKSTFGLTLFDQWSEHIQKLRADGLTVLHVDGTQSRYFLQVTNNIAEMAPADVVLVLVKSYQTATIAPQVAQILKKNGIAITLQNGLGNVEQLAALLTPLRVMAGVTFQGATMVEPGVIRHAGAGPTYFAPTSDTETRVQQIMGIFTHAGIHTVLVDDTASLIWGKLAINASINPLTALLEVVNGALLENELYKKILAATGTEVARVAQAQGIQLPYTDPIRQTLDVCQATAHNRSSMLQDIDRSSRTEIDAICGAVVEYGQRFNVPTPVNKFLFEQVKAKENGVPFDARQLEIIIEDHLG